MAQSALQPIAVEPHMLKNPDGEERQYLQRVWGLQARTDPSVSFEEYRFWAKIEREEEQEANRLYIEKRGALTFTNVLQNRFSKGHHHAEKKEAAKLAAAKGIEKDNGLVVQENGRVTEEEWKTLARALRTASWGTIFFLITTDILGWSSTPFVFASVGFGLGSGLFIIMGIAAAVSGWILWRVFLTLDSSRYPMLSFGDTYFRVYGSKARHFINIFQSLQQFMTVCVLILASGTIIAQLANESVCFIACMIIVMVVGILLGAIRSLQRLGWLANMSVWVNIVSFIIIMVSASRYSPDYQAVTSSTLIKAIGPVETFVGSIPDQYQSQALGFAGQLNGVNQLIYSYGGALLFIAFLAEMRHPMDFWKGMLCAQAFICFVYLLFGAFVYSKWGQYSIFNIGNVVQPLSLQIVGNVLGLITAFIACLLYFNIGMKTIYIEILQELLHFPELTSRKGSYLWYAVGPVYWILAFVVAAAVPNLNGISSIVGALLILNFTYTFPALLYLGFRCQIDATLPGEGFDPYTGVTTRYDSGFKRWKRGFMAYWYINVASTLYFLGGIAVSALGTWAAIVALIGIFQEGGTVATSFGCGSPV